MYESELARHSQTRMIDVYICLHVCIHAFTVISMRGYSGTWKLKAHMHQNSSKVTHNQRHAVDAPPAACHPCDA
jgi:hypothetical protein